MSSLFIGGINPVSYCTVYCYHVSGILGNVKPQLIT